MFEASGSNYSIKSMSTDMYLNVEGAVKQGAKVICSNVPDVWTVKAADIRHPTSIISRY
ncbi:uncharacterized protein EI90DRAFT_3055778 [Cantharellus anzutake]|uniref:uncharacterized protein n=1 Tax=Cantharellus anzutake TaxID=1750568 RepID=UPI001905F66C|nr:uncharacterized protein EI90DRAFT_3055778 [Cantharellus anzutake]KAF8331892.1 hypothetical protein EI90DRAFT_3055778 [Cantharellus anzutake]